MNNNQNTYFVKLAEKWSRILFESNAYDAKPEKARPKFFITAAFMYPNGPIHIGHGRTYLIADIIARFKRVMGYNVLFPMGFHYTGTPIIAMAEAIAEKDKELLELFTTLYKVPHNEIERMSDPLYMARYFHRVSKEVMKLFGLSIDWQREFATIDPEFKTFIHWQFEKLYERGYIERGTHPVGWCPRHGMPVGMHDTKGDVEPEVGEFVAIFFKDSEGIVYPTATLRPETIFGVTNIWVNPKAKYAKIVLSDGSTWVVGARAIERLRHQLEFNVVEYISGEDLVGKHVTNPITGEEVPILPAKFVDDSFATGVVMSVPAHAPYDAIALEELRREPTMKIAVGSITPRVIIKVDGKRTPNAYEALKIYGIVSQDDREKLDEATRYVYSLELRNGHMIEDLHILIAGNETIKKFVESSISSKSVEVAREYIKDFIIKQGYGAVVYELLNKPIYCRCGAEVVVKVLKDQWFINYGDNKWKDEARKALTRMIIIPEEVRPQFEATISWLKRRACARTRGLGVPLPWDSRWVIESLSDSTIYMAFYTVIHKIRESRIPVEKLCREFWDYVLLGEGDVKTLSERLSIPTEVLNDIRNEFMYWYPLDLRISGKDLIPNHLTFFIFNHVAIFPERLQPKGIVANGWVLVKQQKMSKSLRNIIPLKNIIEEYGTDVVRLLIALNAEVQQDENIDSEILDKLGKHEYPQLLMSIHDMVVKLYENREKLRIEMNNIDRLFWNEFLYKILKVVKLLDSVKIREAGIILFYEIRNTLSKYIELVGVPHRVILDALKIWIPLISAYTPFIAEEIWSKTFNEGFASLYVVQIPSELDEHAILALRYSEVIIESIYNIVRATKKQTINSVTIYVAPQDQQRVMKRVVELHRQGLKLGEIINTISNELRIGKKEASQIVKAMYDIIIGIPEELINMYVSHNDINEIEVLKMALDYISNTLNTKVEVYSADDPNAPDKGGKKRSALPLRPGIYVE